jgi:hypothetical protein
VGKLIVAEFMTLDGVAQSGGQPDEDRDGGFSYGGWHAPFRDPEAGKVMFEGAQSMDYSNGMLHLAYETAGEPTYGAIG